MTWCVCSDRSGELSLMTRDERENMLSVFMIAKKQIPTHVVKTFEDKREAKIYIRDIKIVNNMIKKI